MPARLDSIVESVKAEINDATCAHEVGQEHVYKHGRTRRIVWVSAAGKFERPETTAAKPVSTVEGQPPSEMQSALLDRLEDVQVHICDADRAKTEALFEDTVRAIAKIVPKNALEFGGYRWPTQEEAAALSNRGQKITLNITLRWEILKAPEPLFYATAQDHECNLEMPVYTPVDP